MNVHDGVRGGKLPHSEISYEKTKKKRESSWLDTDQNLLRKLYIILSWIIYVGSLFPYLKVKFDLFNGSSTVWKQSAQN